MFGFKKTTAEAVVEVITAPPVVQPVEVTPAAITEPSAVRRVRHIVVTDTQTKDAAIGAYRLYKQGKYNESRFYRHQLSLDLQEFDLDCTKAGVTLNQFVALLDAIEAGQVQLVEYPYVDGDDQFMVESLNAANPASWSLKSWHGQH